MLITDSILRHIEEVDVRFRLYRTNFKRVDKTYAAQLKDPDLVKTIKDQKPHLIYVHLGVNDVQKGSSAARVSRLIIDFANFLAEHTERTKLIISCPLHNGNNRHHSTIEEICSRLWDYGTAPEVKGRIFVQVNDHFHYLSEEHGRQQMPKYFKEDDMLHLSNKGKRAMCCNLRDSLHQVLRVYRLQLDE